MGKHNPFNIEEIEVAGHTLKMDVFGEGDRLLLCLHGFGTSRSIFHFLSDHLPDGTRMVALGLPWLGESNAPNAFLPLQVDDWHTLFDRIISRFPEAQFTTLLGFSLGARVALHFYAYAPQLIGQIILIAADGLQLHPLYRFCVKTSLGRFFFRKTIQHPGWLLRVMRILHTLKLLGKEPYRFGSSQLGNPAIRKSIEQVWLGYAHLKQNRKKMVAEAQAGKISWHLIWGEGDQVIRPKFGKTFAKQVPNTSLNLVKGGHFLLRRPSQELIDTLKACMHQV